MHGFTKFLLVSIVRVKPQTFETQRNRGSRGWKAVSPLDTPSRIPRSRGLLRLSGVRDLLRCCFRKPRQQTPSASPWLIQSDADETLLVLHHVK